MVGAARAMKKESTGRPEDRREISAVLLPIRERAVGVRPRSTPEHW